MTHYSQFGADMREVMLKKGITLTALANSLGISTSYVSKILKGTRVSPEYERKIKEICSGGPTS